MEKMHRYSLFLDKERFIAVSNSKAEYGGCLDTELKIVQELIVTGNPDAHIAKAVGMQKSSVSSVMNGLYEKFIPERSGSPRIKLIHALAQEGIVKQVPNHE